MLGDFTHGEVFEVDISDFAGAGERAGLHGELVGQRGHRGVIHIERLLSVNSQRGNLGGSPGDVDGDFSVCGRGSDTCAVVPIAIAADILLPEPAPLVIAQEQGVARILVAEVEAETVRGTSLRGLDLDGELSSPSQVNRLAANGDSRIATAAGGIAVGGGGLEMSPSRIIASAGCKNFAAFGGVAVNRPAVHGSIVRDGGDIVGVRVIGASR